MWRALSYAIVLFQLVGAAALLVGAWSGRRDSLGLSVGAAAVALIVVLCAYAEWRRRDA